MFEITDTHNGKSYTVTRESECRDTTDASAFREALKTGKTIQMGSVCVTKIK